MTSCSAPTLSAKTKRETSLSHYCKPQSTTEPSALWYSAVPIRKIHREWWPWLPGVRSGVWEGHPSVRPGEWRMGGGRRVCGVGQRWWGSDRITSQHLRLYFLRFSSVFSSGHGSWEKVDILPLGEGWGGNALQSFSFDTRCCQQLGFSDSAEQHASLGLWCFCCWQLVLFPSVDSFLHFPAYFSKQ